MSEDGKGFTEAQMQIERLKKLKENKELKIKKMKNESYTYIKPEKKTRPRRAPNMVKLDKSVFEKVHVAVKKMGKNTKKGRVTKDRLVNAVLDEVLSMEFDFSGIKSKEELKKALKKIKTGG